MRVRILSGHLTGCVQDFPQTEGEVLIATGFGELVATAVEDATSAMAVEVIERAPVEPEASDVASGDAPVDPIETPE